MPTSLSEAVGPKSIGRRIRKAQEDALRALDAGQTDAVKEILALLKTLRADIQRELAAIAPERFAASHLERLLVAVEAAVANFSARAQEISARGSEAAAKLGQKYWDDVQLLLRPPAPGLVPVSPVLSDELLSVVSSMSTELIRGLADDVAAQTKAAIQRAVLGAQTPFEAMRQVSTIVGPRGDVGAGAAAERIVRTEMGRAYNAVDDAMAQKIAEERPEDLPALKKAWIATMDARTRDAHVKAHKQVRDVDEPFRVDGEDIDYPLDPKGSPGNTINCRCVKIVLPEDLLDEELARFPGKQGGE